MTRRNGKYGSYWAASFDVVITLGAVEMKCWIEWEEDGIQKRLPATDIWEDYF
ncbi:hypothetical protein FRB90_012641 [Tulasnella sp. 427]|nr:hypothetical protein FRB90_012641 [Tulasnella sp. 427]